MRVAAIDSVNTTVTVAERRKAFGNRYVAPQQWPESTPVFLHRRSRPEPLPVYMTDSGGRPEFNNFRLSWVGRDVPYLAMNLEFPGGDDEIKDWENLLVYVRLSRSDGQGRAVEGILPLAADAELPSHMGGPGNPYTIRYQHLRRHLGLPNTLDTTPEGAGVVSHVSEIMRDIVLGSYARQTFLREMLDWIYADDGHDLGRIYRSDDRFRAGELEALRGSPDGVSEALVRSYQIDVEVAFLDGTDPRIDAASFSILNPPEPEESQETEEPEDEGEPAEAAAVWSAELYAGIDRSVAPADTGYSRWGAINGALSNDRFSYGGESYRVEFLMHAAGGLYLGLDADVGTDFALRIGDAEYRASQSKDPLTASGADYWWDLDQPAWAPGRPTAVSLHTLQGEVPPRASPPPAARFRNIPPDHNGTSSFTMRLYLTEEFPLSYKTLRDHAIEVENGTLQRVKRVARGSNKIWELTITPESTQDITVTLTQNQNCQDKQAVCTPDGQRLHNTPTATIPGP